MVCEKSTGDPPTGLNTQCTLMRTHTRAHAQTRTRTTATAVDPPLRKSTLWCSFCYKEDMISLKGDEETPFVEQMELFPLTQYGMWQRTKTPASKNGPEHAALRVTCNKASTLESRAHTHWSVAANTLPNHLWLFLRNADETAPTTSSSSTTIITLPCLHMPELGCP